MAKVKSMGLRNYVGKVGGAVYYINKGQNVARELAPQVSNPRSEGQMRQRMQWANLVAAYRVNLPWMKRGAFESKPQTWSDYNAFVSANSGLNPVWLTKDEVARGAAVVAPYIVTKGTLPSVQVTADDSNEVFYTDLYTGADLTISGTTTAAQLSAALLANNNGLREGDQISAILNIQQTTDGVPYVVARYYEFIIDSTDNRTLADLGLEGVLIDDEYNDTNVLCLANGGQTCAGTIILSRSVSGQIQVSTQALVMTASAIAFNATYTTDAAFQQASQSYGESDANFLASGYSGKGSNVAVPTALSVLTIDGLPYNPERTYRIFPTSHEMNVKFSGELDSNEMVIDVTAKAQVWNGSAYVFNENYTIDEAVIDGETNEVQINFAAPSVEAQVTAVDISFRGGDTFPLRFAFDGDVTP